MRLKLRPPSKIQISAFILYFLSFLFAFSLLSFVSFNKQKKLPNVEPISVTPPSPALANQIVLNFKPGTTTEQKEAYIEQIGGTVVSQIDSLGSVTVSVNSETTQESLPQNESLATSEPDYYASILEVPNDPRFGDQWGVKFVWGDSPQIEQGASIQTIAVIDTGICTNHPDLAGQIVEGYNFIQNNSNVEDGNGHGCSVSGTIASIINNNTGVAGITSEAKIMPLKVLDSNGLGAYSNVAAAIVYAVDHGANVINLSLGGANSSTVLENAIDYAKDKNVIVVAAAGNTGTTQVFYPAAYDYVISVGSLDPTIKDVTGEIDISKYKSSFSSYGDLVDIWAPGRDVLTTNRNGDYSFASGTSFAAPFVSGVVATRLSKDGSLQLDQKILSFSDEKQIILETQSNDLNNVLTTYDSEVGSQAIDLNNSLSHIGWPFRESTWEDSQGANASNYWHFTPNSGHTGNDANAQDWNYQGGDSDCDLSVYAPFSGQVVYAECVPEDRDSNGACKHKYAPGGYGNTVIIKSNNNPSYYFRVAHLNAISVSVGDTVNVGGTNLGKVGDTGNSTESCHLHTNLYNGDPVSNLNTSLKIAFQFDASLPADVFGVIKDSGNAVSGAYITFVGGGITKVTIADSSGLFYIRDVPFGPTVNATVYATNPDNTKYWAAFMDYVHIGLNLAEFGSPGVCSQSQKDLSLQNFDPCGGVTPPPSGSCPSYGEYCGSSVGGDTNTLYHCTATGATPQFSQSCSNGCKVNPPGTPDVCIAGTNEKVKFFGDSNYGNLRLELAPGLSNDPSKSTLYKSIQIPNGWSVIAYDEDNQHGNNKCWSASDPLVENSGWHNRIESVSISTTNVCPGNQPDGVFLCSEVSYNGTCQPFYSDAPSLAASGFGNDRAQSIRINGDWAATLFWDDNYNGLRTTLEGGVENLNNYPIGTQASSIKIRKRVPSRFTLYAGGDYASDSFASDRTIDNLDYWNFDERAQSVKVDIGYEIILCTEPNFHGTCGRTATSIGDINSAAQGLRNNVTSVQTCVGACPPAASTPALTLPYDGARFDPGSDVTLVWTANARQYNVEVWGGGLSQTINTSWLQNNVWTKNDLPASDQPYYWHVKSSNDFGDSAWSQTQSFYVQDVAPDQVIVFGTNTGEVFTQYAFNAFVSPFEAKNLVYNWSPTPLNGQGTSVAYYDWSSFGTKDITLTVSNSKGSVNTTNHITIACRTDQYKTEYYNNTSLGGSPVTTECTNTIDNQWGANGPVALQGFGNGSDGELIITQNTTDNPIDAQASGTAGTKLLYATNSSFSSGQKILILQSRGSTSGYYQLNEIETYSGGVITTKDNLNVTYTTDSGANKAQVIVVRQYTNITIRSGATWSAKAWDGSTGGVLAFIATGRVRVYGTIDASGKGFPGAPSDPGGGPGVVKQGKSYLDDSQDYGWDPNQGGGGGGEKHPAGGDGGGGAGYAQGGGNGTSYQGHVGFGGESYGVDDLSRIYLGSGGGGGGSDQDAPSGFRGGAGGTGGGIIMWWANQIDTTNGLIKANGVDGESLPTSGDHGGGGGGGSGGSIKGYQSVGNFGTSKITTRGGNGGNGNRAGGGGSYGRIRMEYSSSITGQTDPNASTYQVPYYNIDNFSARFTKNFSADNKTYIFNTTSDDGSRLLIDNNVVTDNWTDGAHTSSYTTFLSSGNHEIKLEYYEKSGDAHVTLGIGLDTNNSPVINTIPNQIVDHNSSFTSFDLDDYGSDPDGDTLTWSFSGNTNLTFNINANHLVTVTAPANWIGEETITFTAKDQWNAVASTQVKFQMLACNKNQFLTEYYDNNSLSGTPIGSACVDNINYDWGTGGPEVLKGFGNGQDGDIVISADTVDDPITGMLVSGTQGTYALSFYREAPGFQAGQKIFIHQTRGTNAGTIQYTEIVSVSGGVITTKDPLLINFSSAGNDTAQVQVMKQYRNVTVNQGVQWKPVGWNGRQGGFLAFYANGTVTINGTITSSSIWGGVYTHGFQGGGTRRNLGCTGQYGQYGESPSGYVPDPPTCATNQLSNGGGGGSAQSSNGNPTASGGGGGGHAYNGEDGVNKGYPAGQGGSSYDTADLTTINFGSGGGPGGDPAGAASMGGFGGAATIIFAKNLNIGSSGSIKMNGADAATFATPYSAGGGGGGAGGSILIRTLSGNIGTGNIQAIGGQGFDPLGLNGKGGNGSVGRIRVEYIDSLSGQTNPVASTAQVTSTLDNFSTRFNGKYQFDSKNYTFHLSSDDGTKLYIDDNLVIDNWTDGSHDTSFAQLLSTGLHDIKVEYYEKTEGANVSLSWEVTKNPPTDIQLSVVSIQENLEVGTDVGALTTTDPDAGDTFIYSLVTGEGSTDNTSFIIDSDKLKTAASFDFESKNEYSIRARTTDQDELFFEKVFTISVTDVNEPPTVLTIPGQTINEDAAFAVIDLTSFATDPDSLETLTWTSSGNSSLVVEIGTDQKCTITAPQDWNGTETITFRATDVGGLYAEKSAQFVVNPVNDAPVITSTAITTANVYRVYAYQVVATDVDNPALTYSLITAPSAMTVDSTGKISWTPDSSNLGNYDVVLEVNDGSLAVRQSYTMNVSYASDDFVASADEKMETNDAWREDATTGFTITNESEAMKVQNPLNQNAKKFITYDKWINVEVGKKYYFAANVKTSNADAAAVTLKLYDANFTLLGNAATLTATAGTKGWTEYRTNYIIPATMATKAVKYATIVLKAGDKYVAGADALTYFDDVYFSKNGRPYTGAFTVTPTKIKEGAAVTLKAGTVTDPDANTIFTYLWEQVDGPTITIANNTSKIATFVAPADVDKDYTVSVRLTVGDGQTSGISKVQTINVIGILEANFSEEFTTIDRWTNKGPANFANTLDGETMLIQAKKAAVVSNIVTTQFIKVENVDQRLTYKIKGENVGSFAITMNGYDSNLVFTTYAKTCTATGFSGTKDWTEFSCDTTMFRLRPSIKYVKIVVKFKSVSTASKLWIDYLRLQNPALPEPLPDGTMSTDWEEGAIEEEVPNME